MIVGAKVASIFGDYDNIFLFMFIFVHCSQAIAL